MFRRHTPALLGADRKPFPGSISTLEPVSIGGVEQWVLARGYDPTAPVLVWLHGGPGQPQILLARQTQAELERAFVVVNWDQRGAGLSYRRDLPSASMTVERLVEDTVEVSRWAAQRFARDKVVLAGHSWGSVLGLLAVARAPEVFESYIGVSQVVEPAESEQRMYRWARGEADRLGQARAGRDLERLGAPPYPTPRARRAVHRWVDRFGGRVHQPGTWRLALSALTQLKEYTLWDLARYRSGHRFSLRTLSAELSSLDLARRVARVEVPTYFIAGRYDRISDPALAKEYLTAIDAPRKGWAWIEDAAHLAPFEQPDAVAAALAHFAHDARGPAAPSWTIAG